jgi:hypothetical protein
MWRMEIEVNERVNRALHEGEQSRRARRARSARPSPALGAALSAIRIRSWVRRLLTTTKPLPEPRQVLEKRAET